MICFVESPSLFKRFLFFLSLCIFKWGLIDDSVITSSDPLIRKTHCTNVRMSLSLSVAGRIVMDWLIIVTSRTLLSSLPPPATPTGCCSPHPGELIGAGEKSNQIRWRNLKSNIWYLLLSLMFILNIPSFLWSWRKYSRNFTTLEWVSTRPPSPSEIVAQWNNRQNEDNNVAQW